ncbi:MAG: hypothetical protein ACLSFT_05470 [Ruminococcus callidus]
MKLFENEQAGVKREKTCCSLTMWKMPAAWLTGCMPYYVFNFTANFEKEVWIGSSVPTKRAGLPTPASTATGT